MADFTPKKDPTATKGGIGAAPEGAETMEPPRIYLQDHHIKKLGLTKMPPVGSKINVSGLAHVGATNESNDPGIDGGKRRSMTLHLHKMDLGTDGPGKEVDQEAESKKGAKKEMDEALKRREGGSKKKDSEGAEGEGSAVPRGGGEED
jgi:hypothetical protein